MNKTEQLLSDVLETCHALNIALPAKHYINTRGGVTQAANREPLLREILAHLDELNKEKQS